MAAASFFMVNLFFIVSPVVVLKKADIKIGMANQKAERRPGGPAWAVAVVTADEAKIYSWRVINPISAGSPRA
jgi:hypothetical protein